VKVIIEVVTRAGTDGAAAGLIAAPKRALPSSTVAKRNTFNLQSRQYGETQNGLTIPGAITEMPGFGAKMPLQSR
jgi:hypothetical protein